MARAGELVAETIALLGENIRPGITTGELDRIAEEFIRDHGGIPTSKGYRGFPAATCISPNSMVVHGIAGAHRVEEGELISVDVHDDDWSISPEDGSLAAHFEHTVAILEDGPRILTEAKIPAKAASAG